MSTTGLYITSGLLFLLDILSLFISTSKPGKRTSGAHSLCAAIPSTTTKNRWRIRKNRLSGKGTVLAKELTVL
jgi:hypothetical protein